MKPLRQFLFLLVLALAVPLPAKCPSHRPAPRLVHVVAGQGGRINIWVPVEPAPEPWLARLLRLVREAIGGNK